MTASSILIALTLFQLKHLVADFWLQTPWMVDGKCRYAQAGGIAHAAIHIAGTAPILIWLAPFGSTGLAILAAEFLVHYHIDWMKARHAQRTGLTPEHRLFWGALGLDQALHQLTYIAILWWLALGPLTR